MTWHGWARAGASRPATGARATTGRTRQVTVAVPVVDAVVARRNRLRAGIAGLRARHEWLDHLSRTGERYFQQRGNHFAAAVTFFSVLTAVPC